MADRLEKEERAGFIRRYVSGLRFPQLFAILAVLFLVDFVIYDPIPFLDEAILGVLTVMLGLWRRRREEKQERRPPMKNVTPKRAP